MSFSHVTIGVADIDRALGFYLPLMDALGWRENFAPCDPSDEPWAGFLPPGTGGPQFVVTEPFDGRPAHPGNGNMVAFEVATRDAVETTHALALSLGATDEGAPGPRPHYHADYFGAYLRDPDGNKLCVVCHPAP